MRVIAGSAEGGIASLRAGRQHPAHHGPGQVGAFQHPGRGR